MRSTERYTELRQLGQGAFKKVTLCFDKETQREVAFASPSVHEDRLYESFLREARINALLDHPNIVPVYDAGVDAFNVPYFVMKVLDGETFRSVMQKAKKDQSFCTLRERLEIFLKVCDAMSHSHKKGIKHLDLKPENFQVNDYGAVHICDWGLAGVNDKFSYQEFDYYDSNFRTLSGEVKGTPGYMAPEQARGEAGTKDNRTDIFALGAVLYEILCFKIPFGGKDIREVIVSTCLEDALSPRKARPDLNIPVGVEAVAMKAISKEPHERYQTVDELKSDVEAFLQGYATEAEEAGFSKQVKLLYQRNKLFLNSSCFLLCAIIALSIIFYSNLEAKQTESMTALNEVTKQETELKQNLKSLKEERQLNKQISPLTAKKYGFEAHRTLTQKHDFKLTEKHCLTALLLNPDEQMAKIIQARLEFIRQNYDKSLSIYKKLDLMEREVAALGKKLIGKKRNIRDVYSVTKNMTKKHAGHSIKLCSWQYAIFEQKNITQVEEDLSWLLSELNKGEKIQAKVYKNEDSYVIDLRDQKNLIDISYLKAAPVSELILSGTGIIDLETLRWIPRLKKLTIEKNRIKKHMLSHLNKVQITFEETMPTP